MSTTYPLSDQISIAFSALEDRLVVRSHNSNGKVVWLLLTRRMTLVVLRQLLSQLHRISDLDKTPAQYWLDLLQMDHQQAMQNKSVTDDAAADTHPAYTAPLPAAQMSPRPATEPTASAASALHSAAEPNAERALYIATRISLENYPRYALLAFQGLPMPKAMTTPSAHLPVFAIRLDRDHLHQLIRLLTVKAKQAHWDLPVTIPWLEGPAETTTTSVDLGLLH